MNRISIDYPHLHAMVVHFPVVLTIVALVAALAGAVFGSRTAWLYAMISLTAAGALVYPIHWTGDLADHALRDPWYIRRGAIGVHDSSARITMIALLVAGAFAALGLWKSAQRPAEVIPKWIRVGVLVCASVGTGAVVYTAYLGGLIIHDAPVLHLSSPPTGFPVQTAPQEETGR